METVKLIRLLIEQTKNIQKFKEELWEFIRIPRERTNLKYDIFVDNNAAYKSHHHPLWLYVDCGQFKVPITIEPLPKIMTFIKKNEYDFSDVYEFIDANHTILEKLANLEIQSKIFYHLLKGVCEAQIQNTEIICEMATLHKSESQLPTLLWLDDDKLYLPHAPRIKFRADFQNNDTRHDPSMEIKDPTKIHNMPQRVDLTTIDIRQIQFFVKANQESLLLLADKEIDFDAFKEQMKFVDTDGNIINSVDEVSIGKFVNGFAICKKGEKYNYITQDGSYLFKEYILDSATNFNHYDGNIFLAYVSINGRYFYIDSNGKEIDLY